jgi:hypothetical protein
VSSVKATTPPQKDENVKPNIIIPRTVSNHKCASHKKLRKKERKTGTTPPQNNSKKRIFELARSSHFVLFYTYNERMVLTDGGKTGVFRLSDRILKV